MTTINLRKNYENESKPLINPILQNTTLKPTIEPFSKFNNSIEPDLIPINPNNPKYKLNTPKPKVSWISVIFSLIANLILICVFSIFILKLFVFQQVEVDGLSMYPNFNDHDYLLMNSIDKNFERGQVVALYSNDKFAYKATHELNPWDSYFARFDCKNPRVEAECNAKFFLKRIIGLPNEEIEIINSDVIIYNKESPNGKIIKEDYIPANIKDSMKKSNYRFAKTKIPENKYFVMGDNRTNSTDSRVIGSIANYAIFGKQNYRVGNFVINNRTSFWDAFATRNFFELPKYKFSPIPEEYQSLLSN